MKMPRCYFDQQFNGSQQRLPFRLASAQSMDGEVAGKSIELTADESVRPLFVHRHRCFQDGNGSAVGGTAQKYNQRLANLVRQDSRQRLAQWSCFDSGGMALAVGLDKLSRVLLKAGQPGVLATMPDLGLPEMIEAFDFGLEACFSRRRKDRHETEAQTQMDDPSQTTGQTVWALEASIIVKLRVVGKAKEPPMCGQAGQHIQGGKGRLRPGRRQAAIEGNAIEHGDRGAATNGQVFDEIEGVQLDRTLGQIWQIPTWRRRNKPTAMGGEQEALPAQNSFDGASTGRRGNLFLQELAPDGFGSELAQGTVVFEPGAQREDAFDNRFRGAVGRTRIAAGAVLPIHTLEALTLSAVIPFPSGAQADLEAAGHLPEGSSLA